MLERNKGFTLVEVVAVIAVLAAIALITIPVISNLIKNSKSGAVGAQINEIKASTKNYVLNNINEFVDNGVYTINLGALKKKGLVDIYIKNPSTGKLLDDSMPIEITILTNSYSFKIGDCESDCLVDSTSSPEEFDTDRPVIVLSGSAVEYLELDASFDCVGNCYTPSNNGYTIKYSKYNENNNTWSDYSSANNIDTKILSKYKIEYSYKVNTKSAIPVIRTVIVRDTTKPVISFPAGKVLYVRKVNDNYEWSSSNSDLYSDVTISDNSLERPFNLIVPSVDNPNPNENLVTESNCSPLIGECFITYKYTDLSGNTRSKVRKIMIEEE